LVPPSTYLPAGNRNFVRGYINVPPGYTLDEFKRIAGVVEDYLRPFWTAELGTPAAAALPKQLMPVGKSKVEDAGDSLEQETAWVQPPPMSNFFFVAYSGNVFFGSSRKDPERVAPLQHVMEQAAAGIPGVATFARQSSIFGRISGGNSISLYISGEDIGKVIPAAMLLAEQCRERFGFSRPDPQNFDIGRPEVQVRPDPVKAADVGLSVRDI